MQINALFCDLTAREEIPCDGETPLINPLTGKDYFCGEGPDSRSCPPSSYCHKTAEFAKCCKEGTF